MMTTANADAILSDHSQQLAEHRARIVALEYSRDVAADSLKSLADKLDSLKLWMMTTLAAALAGILAQLLHGK